MLAPLALFAASCHKPEPPDEPVQAVAGVPKSVVNAALAGPDRVRLAGRWEAVGQQAPAGADTPATRMSVRAVEFDGARCRLTIHQPAETALLNVMIHEPPPESLALTGGAGVPLAGAAPKTWEFDITFDPTRDPPAFRLTTADDGRPVWTVWRCAYEFADDGRLGLAMTGLLVNIPVLHDPNRWPAGFDPDANHVLLVVFRRSAAAATPIAPRARDVHDRVPQVAP